MIHGERLIEILDKLLSVEPEIPLRVDLWGYNEIAAYLKMKPRTVGDGITKRPGFPQAIYLPSKTGAGRSHPLWKAAEVIAWAESYQEKRVA